MVIAYSIPDSKIGQDVRDLTGKQGKIVFLSLGSKDKDVLEFKHRYGLSKAGAVLTDEFGNLLKSGLKDSEEISDAYYELDELMAERFQTWNKAVKKGKLLIDEERYPEAADVLKVFAFATGTNLAKEGKKLFDKVAQVAADEYEKLMAETAEKKAKDLDKETRDKMLVALSSFIEKWPKTPAAFSADNFKLDIVTVKDAR